MTTRLYCWASGLAQFGNNVPDGAIEIANSGTCRKADIPKWKRKITVMLRVGYKGELLVPGIPEAMDQADGVEALIKFKELLKQLKSV